MRVRPLVLREDDADRAAHADHVQSRDKPPGGIEIELDYRVAVLVCDVASAVRRKAEEARRLSKARIKSDALQITSRPVDPVDRDGIRVPVRDEDVTARRVYHHLGGVGVARLSLGNGGQLLKRFERAALVVELEVKHLVALFFAEVDPAVVGVDGGVARLVPRARHEARRLGESAGLFVVFQSAELSIAVDAPLRGGEQVVHAFIPYTLMYRRDLARLLPLVCEGRDDFSERAVPVPLDAV